MKIRDIILIAAVTTTLNIAFQTSGAQAFTTYQQDSIVKALQTIASEVRLIRQAVD